jgi:hypothetical protein
MNTIVLAFIPDTRLLTGVKHVEHDGAAEVRLWKKVVSWPG